MSYYFFHFDHVRIFINKNMKIYKNLIILFLGKSNDPLLTSILHFKMLEPIRNILSTKRIVLASGSPRRREILKNVVIESCIN